jgi:hypothetical protein
MLPGHRRTDRYTGRVMDSFKSSPPKVFIFYFAETSKKWWLMIFKKMVGVYCESYEILKQTVAKRKSVNVTAGSIYSYHRTLRG